MLTIDTKNFDHMACRCNLNAYGVWMDFSTTFVMFGKNVIAKEILGLPDSQPIPQESYLQSLLWLSITISNTFCLNHYVEEDNILVMELEHPHAYFPCGGCDWDERHRRDHFGGSLHC